MDEERYCWDLPLPEGLRQALERLGQALDDIANRNRAATQTAVPACASCGGKLGGCFFTRKTDGKQFCSVACCERDSVVEDYTGSCAPPCGFPHPDLPDMTAPPNPPTAIPEPPRSRCCNAETFEADGRRVCSRCRLTRPL